MKSIPFPDHKAVAGVDQGYAPLHFRDDLIQIKDRRAKGGIFEQRRFRYAFLPSPEELADLNAGRAIYLDLWHDVIPPMKMHVFDTDETLPTRISSVEGEDGHDAFVKRNQVEGWTPLVFLDDEPVADCSMADTVLGHVRVLKRDSDNQVVMMGDDFVTIIKTGKVEIQWIKS